jgi:hypothetical protein
MPSKATRQQPVDPLGMTAKAMPANEIARILESGDAAVDQYLGHDIYANSRPDHLARQR